MSAFHPAKASLARICFRTFPLRSLVLRAALSAAAPRVTMHAVASASFHSCYASDASGSGSAKSAPRTDSPWQEIGVSHAIVDNLTQAYPHITEPTRAQRAFLRSVLEGKDVFLKDGMGHGKTLALAIAALSITARDPGARIVILVPTPHLGLQIHSHLEALASPSAADQFAHLSSPASNPISSPRIIIATPANLSHSSGASSFRPSHIFVDEPDTILGPIPSRFYPAHLLHLHPINRHPPALISLLNHLLGITQTMRDGVATLDFANRRRIAMVWTSATMNSQLRRFVKNRGWVSRHKHQVVDLDFSRDVSDRQRQTRDELQDGNGYMPATVKPSHYAFRVDPVTGDLSPLEERLPARSVSPRNDTRELSPLVIEALALLQATSPVPPGKYSLVLPPERTSLLSVQSELGSLSIDSRILTPENIEHGLADFVAPILIANRSSIPGLHLANLHTIYLLDGLDMAGLSDAQKKRGGEIDRVRYYDVVAGRVGRLGTETEGEDQKVISLVLAGSDEEKGLVDMFWGRLSADGQGVGKERAVGGKAVPKRRLSEWKEGEQNAEGE